MAVEQQNLGTDRHRRETQVVSMHAISREMRSARPPGLRDPRAEIHGKKGVLRSRSCHIAEMNGRRALLRQREPATLIYEVEVGLLGSSQQSFSVEDLAAKFFGLGRRHKGLVNYSSST